MKLLILISTLLLAPFASAQTWTIDTNHTQVDFQIRRVPVSNVRGSFSHITGTMIWDEKNPTKASVDIVIPTASISTANDARDKHLKSPDFFDVEKYPTMTFKSTAVTGAPGKLQIVGDLTLAGVTKSVTLDVDGPSKPLKGPGTKVAIGFAATGIVKRSDFHFGPKFDTLILGDEVKFTIDVEADHQ